MYFKPDVPDQNFPIARWVSMAGRWEIGLVPMMFGVRVRLGLIGHGWVVLDLCAGADPEFQRKLLRTVMVILIPQPEAITEGELEELFPICKAKPIFNDVCWSQLQSMANYVIQSLSKSTVLMGERKLVEIKPEPL
jgi:hypothetical protein